MLPPAAVVISKRRQSAGRAVAQRVSQQCGDRVMALPDKDRVPTHLYIYRAKAAGLRRLLIRRCSSMTRITTAS